MTDERPPPGTAADEAVRRAAASWGLDPAEVQPSPNGLLTGLRNGAWLDRQQFPPLAYAVPGIVPEGVVLMVGPPKIGKSWMVLSHALAVAAGGVTLGSIAVGPPGRRCIWLWRTGTGGCRNDAAACSAPTRSPSGSTT